VDNAALPRNVAAALELAALFEEVGDVQVRLQGGVECTGFGCSDAAMPPVLGGAMCKRPLGSKSPSYEPLRERIAAEVRA
jgi:hypothetical protein